MEECEDSNANVLGHNYRCYNESGNWIIRCKHCGIKEC